MSEFVSNKDAYDTYVANDRRITQSVQSLIEKRHLLEEDSEVIRYKYYSLQKSRESSRKRNELEIWDNMVFHSIPLPVKQPRKKRISEYSGSDSDGFSVVTLPGLKVFSEHIATESKKHIIECNLITSRQRLKVLLEHINFIAERELIEPKKLVALTLELVSNETYDRDTSRVCKEIIEKGSFNKVVTKISIPKSAHLLDILEIGSTKYSQLKRILKGENVKLPPYKVVSLFRSEISLADEMRIVQNPEGFSVGIAISYHSILSLTIQRALENLIPFQTHNILLMSQYQTDWMVQVLTASTIKSIIIQIYPLKVLSCLDLKS